MGGDELRLETERTALQRLLPELEKTWSGIIAENEQGSL